MMTRTSRPRSAAALALAAAVLLGAAVGPGCGTSPPGEGLTDPGESNPSKAGIRDDAPAPPADAVDDTTAEAADLTP